MTERLRPASGSLGQRLTSLFGRPTPVAAVPSIDSTEGAPIDELVRRIRARRADREALPSGGPAWSAAVAEERLLTDALRRRSTTITPEGLAWLIGLRPGEHPAAVGAVTPATSPGEPGGPMAPGASHRAARGPRPRHAAPATTSGTAEQTRRRGVARGPA